MADISRLGRLVNGVLRGVDLSSNTLVLSSLKLSTTELTKAILDKLLLINSTADADGSFDTRYLGISATAADSSKLNGQSASYYAIASHNHDAAYLGLHATADDSAKLNGQSASYYALASHNHDATYLGISATAADSSKLNGQSASYYEVADATILKQADVVNDLVHTDTNKPLSAAQGKALQDSKLALAGGTMSGNIAMGGSKVTGLGSPLASADAATKQYVDTAVISGSRVKEAILSAYQLSDTQGILPAAIIDIEVNPDPNDTISIKNAAGTETWTFKASRTGAYEVAIGATHIDTMTNLAAAISTDSSQVGGYYDAALTVFDQDSVVVVFDESTASLPSTSRIYGSITPSNAIFIIPFNGDLEYSTNKTDVLLPSSDPVTTQFGFGRTVASLVDGEIHVTLDQNVQKSWNASLAAWVTMSGASSIPDATSASTGGTKGKVTFDSDKGLAVVSGVAEVKIDNSSIEFGSGGALGKLQVKALGITAAMLAGSIGYSKLSLSNSIINSDIASNAAIVESKLSLDYSTSSLNTAIGGKEPAISAGTTSQYWRGDKSWQTLNTAAVAEDPSYLYFTASRAKTAAVLNTLAGSETDQAPSVSAVNTALSGKEPTLSAGTTSQYYRGDKSWQTLDTVAVAENATNKYFTDGRAQTAAVENAINSGTTNKAPSEDAVFTALAAKAPNTHEHSRIQKTMVAGETFEANTTYAVRLAMVGETAGRVYKAEYDASVSDKFYVVGVVQVATEASAGDSVTVLMLGEISLGSADVAFASGEIGQAVHLKSAGAWDAVSQITYAASQASVRFAVVQETSKMLICGMQVNGVN